MILLTILKIIGICILAILAVLLLILLTLLFVPVRYCSTGKLGKDEKEVTAKVSWLASAVSATAAYRDGKAVWAVKLFGIQILPKKTAEKGGRKKKASDGESETEKEEASDGGKDTEKEEASDGGKETGKEEASDGGKDTGKEETSDGEENTGKKKTSDGKSDKKKRVRKRHSGKQEEKEGQEAPEKAKGTKKQEKTEEPEEFKDSENKLSEGEKDTSESENTEEQTPSPSFFERIIQKISHFFAGIRERFRKIREQISGIFEKIKGIQTKFREIKKKAERWKKFYYLAETQVTLGVLKTEVKKLIRYVLPTRIRANIHFGFEDPADTGVTLGAISAVYGFFPKGISLESDFEEKVLEGEWKFRGRIRLAYFVRLVIRLVCRRENRVTLRRFRKLLKG